MIRFAMALFFVFAMNAENIQRSKCPNGKCRGQSNHNAFIEKPHTGVTKGTTVPGRIVVQKHR